MQFQSNMRQGQIARTRALRAQSCMRKIARMRALWAQSRRHVKARVENALSRRPDCYMRQGAREKIGPN
jgi:hypothetical protein